MVKHIILWKLKENTYEAKLEIKNSLESLVGKVPGLINAEVIIDNLDSSTVDCMLISTLASIEDLKAYANNPLHLDIINNVIKPKIETRIAFDYQE